MNVQSKRYFNTTCHVVSFSPKEIRLEAYNGIPNLREYIHNMWGNPKLTEVTCFKANGTFFGMKDPKSEILGPGRGDQFLNIAFAGEKLYIEPDIPKEIGNIVGSSEVSTSYCLVRNGQRDYTNEKLFKEILGSNPRMIMGQRFNGDIVFIAAEGRKLTQKGLTSEEERSVSLSEGLVNAVNNDGGGSTVIYVEDKKVNWAYDGRKLGYIWVGYRKWKGSELPKLLKKGSKGMWVNLLQRMLYLTPDGAFGPVTEKAVIAYQKACNLKVDGKVGPQTWASLCNTHALI